MRGGRRGASGSCSPRGRAGAPPPAEGAGEALANTAVGARGALPVLRGPGGARGAPKAAVGGVRRDARAPQHPRPGPPPSGQVRRSAPGPRGWGGLGPSRQGQTVSRTAVGAELRGADGATRSTPRVEVSLQTPVSIACMHIVQNVSREFTALSVTTARPLNKSYYSTAL